jgi:ribose/xylose/arabinose/galactoside ABC-type transport system permease subunit
VSVGAMIDQPAPPSPLKVFINQTVIPQAIDAAGAVESAAYTLGEQVKARPIAAIAIAGLLGLIVGRALFRPAITPE